MKTIIVYYSLTGNVAQTAQKLAEALGADTLALEPEKAYPDKGAKKFLWGGKCAVMKEKPALKPYDFAAENYDRVILATPVWASTFAPPLRTFVEDNRAALAGKTMAALVCCSGGGPEKALAKLAALVGCAWEATAILIDPKDRPDPKNDAALDDFIAKLK